MGVKDAGRLRAVRFSPATRQNNFPAAPSSGNTGRKKTCFKERGWFGVCLEAAAQRLQEGKPGKGELWLSTRGCWGGESSCWQRVSKLFLAGCPLGSRDGERGRAPAAVVAASSVPDPRQPFPRQLPWVPAKRLPELPGLSLALFPPSPPRPPPRRSPHPRPPPKHAVI